MWRSKDNFQGLFLFLHRVGSGDQIQVVSLGSKSLYLVSHLPNPCKGFSKTDLLSVILSFPPQTPHVVQLGISRKPDTIPLLKGLRAFVRLGLQV